MRRLITLLVVVTLTAACNLGQQDPVGAETLPTTTTTIPETTTLTTTTTLPPTTTTTVPETTTTTIAAADAVPFVWGNEASALGPLGPLPEEELYNWFSTDPGYTLIVKDAYLAVVPGVAYENADGDWILPINFGVSPLTGEEIVVEYNYGACDRQSGMNRGTGNLLPFDPENSDLYIRSDYEEMAVCELLGSLRTDWMYPIVLTVLWDVRGPLPPWCVERDGCTESMESGSVGAENNAKVLALINGELSELSSDPLTFLPQFWHALRFIGET